MIAMRFSHGYFFIRETSPTPPGNNPAGISLYKIDSQTGEAWAQGAADLAGAQFTVKYFDGYYDEDTLPETATRTWVLETKYVDGKYRARLLDEYKVSGDAWYYDEFGTITLPLGTYTVQETLAPTGYLLEGADVNSKNWVSENTYEAPAHVGQVTTDGVTVNSLSIGNEMDGGNELTASENVTRFDITLLKHDGETQASLGSIEFSLTSLTTGETHNFWTDDTGEYTSDADVNPHSYDTDNAESRSWATREKRGKSECDGRIRRKSLTFPRAADTILLGRRTMSPTDICGAMLPPHREAERGRLLWLSSLFFCKSKRRP